MGKKIYGATCQKKIFLLLLVNQNSTGAGKCKTKADLQHSSAEVLTHDYKIEHCLPITIYKTPWISYASYTLKSQLS